MSRPRFLRVETRPKGTVTYCELRSGETGTFSPDETTALDLGCTITRPDAHITDLIAYYDAAQAALALAQAALALLGLEIAA